MSNTSSKSDQDKMDAVKRKVDRIYDNYGIDSSGMEDGDLSTVYRYYYDRPSELDRDYKESQAYTGRFDDEEIL